jgi:DNA polymerase
MWTSLDALRDGALACRDCDLWEHATQAVFGEGPPDARGESFAWLVSDRELALTVLTARG